MHNMKMPAGPDHESTGKFDAEAEIKAPEAASPAMKVESVLIRPTKNGGYLVTCSKVSEGKRDGNGIGGSNYHSEDYAFTSADEAMAFVHQELGMADAGSSAAAPVPPKSQMPPKGAMPPMPPMGGDMAEDDEY